MKKGRLITLVVTIVILIICERLIPQKYLAFPITFSLIINIFCWIITSENPPIKYIARFFYRWESITKKFLSGKSQHTQEELQAFLSRHLLKGKAITPQFIEKLSEKSSAALVISLQGAKNIKQSPTLEFSHFKAVANKATKWAEYRKYLLNKATSEFPNTQQIAESLDTQSEYVTGDDLKSISDDAFTKELEKAKNETIHVFTTTSQLSSDFIATLSNHKKGINTLHFYICSPCILSHKSLLDLEQEYENPIFTRQKGQFVSNNDQSVHVEADMVRRMIKILGAIRELSKLADQFTIKVHFFTLRYPGVKIKLLEERGYAQIQPGPLTYSNNLYRFAVEVQKTDDIRTLKKDLESFRDSNKIETHLLSKNTATMISEMAIKEICQWLCTRGMTPEKLEIMHSRIKDVAKAPDSDKIIDEISLKLKKVSSVLQDSDSVSEIFSSDHSIVHTSVGLIIEENQQLLLIKKSDPFYLQKYSIVAGHVNRHETPVEAIHREVYEELGVKLSNPQLVKPPFELDDACRHGAQRHLWYVFKAQLDSQDYQTDSSEISKTKLVPKNGLKADLLTPGALGVLKQLGYLS